MRDTFYIWGNKKCMHSFGWRISWLARAWKKLSVDDGMILKICYWEQVEKI